MHRRQYLPGSHVKTSRAKLLRERTELQGRIRQQAGVLNEQGRAIAEQRAREAKTIKARITRLLHAIRAHLTRTRMAA